MYFHVSLCISIIWALLFSTSSHAYRLGIRPVRLYRPGQDGARLVGAVQMDGQHTDHAIVVCFQRISHLDTSKMQSQIATEAQTSYSQQVTHNGNSGSEKAANVASLRVFVAVLLVRGPFLSFTFRAFAVRVKCGRGRLCSLAQRASVCGESKLMSSEITPHSSMYPARRSFPYVVSSLLISSVYTLSAVLVMGPVTWLPEVG